MKARQIEGGGIRIVMEDEADWHLLSRLLMDARDAGFDLAGQVGGGIADEEVAEDWREFVLPDLREEFDGMLARVSHQVGGAYGATGGGQGEVVISRGECGDWYGVLNRARLALEARYGLAGAEMGKAAKEVRGARLRDRLYCALQSLLLDHLFD